MRGYLALTILLCVHGNAQALMGCANLPKITPFRELIHKVAQYGEADRKTEEQYAQIKQEPVETIKRRFAATGDLTCNGAKVGIDSQANLTVRKDVIVTVFHSTVEEGDCSKRTVSPKNCIFTVNDGRGPQVARVASVINSGLQCPQGKKATVYNDWLVLKLDRCLDVEPYRLDAAVSTGISANDHVVAVGKSLDFLPGGGVPMDDRRKYPKHIADCDVPAVERTSQPQLIATNCDSAHLTSGGALLDRNVDSPVLIAIMRGSPLGETVEQQQQSGRTGTSVKCNYTTHDCASYYVPVANKLLDTLTGLKQNDPCPLKSLKR